MSEKNYPRDLIGYGQNPPNPNWPGQAKIAVQFVINYEIGAENNILDGDKYSESFLSEIIGAQPMEGKRNLGVESCFEYGSRVGIWRLFDLFKKKRYPCNYICSSYGIRT